MCLTEWVAIVDEDADMATRLHDLLELFAIKTQHFSDAKSYIDSDLFSSAHVALVDLELSDMSGLDIIRLAVQKSSALAIFAMARHGTIPLAVRSIKFGAADFLEKPFSIEPVVDVFKAAPSDIGALNNLGDDLTSQLTPREGDVLTHLVKGAASKNIARALSISHRTVEVHRRHIFRKLKVSNLAELILLFR